MRWRGASILTVVASEVRKGRPEEARRLILEGQQLMETLPIPGYSVHGATLMLGEIGWQQGRLHQAEQYYRQLLASAKENSVDQMAAQLGLAKVFYEWNHLAEAEQSVALVLELGKYFVEVGFLFPASLLQARLSQARGEYVQAQESLQKLLAEALEGQLTALYRMVLTQQVELALATGLLTSVKDWQATSNFFNDADSAMQQEQEALLRARVLIARGEIAAALVVSINTVKTQVQSIYRKLGVKSRWEASEAAHRLDLL